MKKSIVLACGLFLLAGAANAAVVVSQSDKKATYANGSEIKVNGSSDTTVDYNGVKIFIPKGVVLTIGQGADGAVQLRASSLSGVKVGDNVLNSNTNTVISVQPKTQQITVVRGTVQVTDASGKTVSYAAGSIIPSSVFVPAFVAPAAISAASQQSVQNVEEDPTLSPSAPRL